MRGAFVSPFVDQGVGRVSGLLHLKVRPPLQRRSWPASSNSKQQRERWSEATAKSTGGYRRKRNHMK